jgi:hypothetical protein
MADEDEFLKSLRVAKDLDEEDGNPKPATATKPRSAQSRASGPKGGGLAKRRASGGRNVPFNHSVLRETAEGYIALALKHDWTMNVTLTKALELLKRADEEGKL